jgi:HAE1 family hydrophobic/amphiphilic exporter-1
VLAKGAGAQGRKVMGMSVFAGMAMATVIGVVLVPMLFVLVERLSGSGKHTSQETKEDDGSVQSVGNHD